MGTMLITAFIVLLAVALFFVTAFVLSYFNICFTQIEEGTAKAVMQGRGFHHFIMRWRGHYLHDPRRYFHDRRFPDWEVYPLQNNSYGYVSAYRWWELHWRFLELAGIYWFGLYPFKQIYVYRFRWTEQTSDAEGKSKSRFRDEHTDFIFVKDFTYWIKLQAAEDKGNFPLDLDYLLTVRSSNPYRSLFRIDDWLGRLTADANNDAKIYVGCSAFEEIKRESKSAEPQTSDFAARMLKLNFNVVTEPDTHGTKMSYGITVAAASLVDANPSGKTSEEVQKALSAKRIAELEAEATVAAAEGDAKATRIRAEGQAKAIDTVYTKVREFGEDGIVLQQLDALKQASTSPGSTVIWANDPIGGLAAALRGTVKSAQSQPQTPPSSTTQ